MLFYHEVSSFQLEFHVIKCCRDVKAIFDENSSEKIKRIDDNNLPKLKMNRENC